MDVKDNARSGQNQTLAIRPLNITAASMYPMIIIQILCSIILTCNSIPTEELSGLLNRLYRSAAQNNRPLVLIIDRGVQKENVNFRQKPNDLLQTSDESKDLPAIFLIKSHGAQSQNVKAPSSDEGKVRDHRGHYYKPNNRLQKYKGHHGQLRVIGTTPSPVLKTLLRYKNEMNCEANNECQIECKIRFTGNKRNNCKNKCEMKFECEQADDYTDPCDNDTDECGDDKNPSTRGVRLVTDQPLCPKC